MSTTAYMMAGWATFLTLVYTYMFYDIYAERIQLRKKWQRLVETFTEEE